MISKPLAIFAVLACPWPAIPGQSRAVEIRSVGADGILVAADVGGVRLQGVDLPKAGPQREALIAKLRSLVGSGSYELCVDAKDPDTKRVQVGTLRRLRQPKTVNEEILEAGLAFFRTRSGACRDQASLLAAAMRAKQGRRGVWANGPVCAGKPPGQKGASLGLYYKVEAADYHEQIDRIHAVGADWVQLLLTTFVDRVDSSVVERDRHRTVSDARLVETIGYARKKGLRVALLPIVLIRHAGEDDWRGTLRPRDPGAFWLSYDKFLCHYLDIARDHGVELFYVGSELCSLEKEHAVWQRLIHNARGRYSGWLTYSANWDHYDVPRFWHLLDQVGLTAYFELTQDKDAKPEALVAAWRRIRGELATTSRKLGRSIVLTELGYPSQNGANTAPWNYYLAQDDIDLQEQADCWRAFATTMKDAPFLRGIYVYDFFEKGGAEDHTYAIWQKPAWHVVQGFLREFSPISGK